MKNSTNNELINIIYTVEDTETGNVFDSFTDLNKAIEWVKELVLEDIQNGTYKEDYHSIYKEESGEKELLFVDSDIISKEEAIASPVTPQKGIEMKLQNYINENI